MKKDKLTKNALALFKENNLSLLPDNESHRYRMKVPSETSDREYIVAQNKRGMHTGRWECSCRGWIMHRKCKHLSAMMPLLSKVVSLAKVEDKRHEKKRR